MLSADGGATRRTSVLRVRSIISTSRPSLVGWLLHALTTFSAAVRLVVGPDVHARSIVGQALTYGSERDCSRRSSRRPGLCDASSVASGRIGTFA